MAMRSAEACPFKHAGFEFGGESRSDAAPGFRHFLAKPLASQRFRAFGIDPLDEPAHLPEVRNLMSRLSRRMDEEVKWTPLGDRPLERWENPSIPSGYTYLLQFVAHDLVQSAIPLSIAGALGAGTANARRAPDPRTSRASTAAFRGCARP